MESFAAAVAVLREAGRILVFTGAGISTESGIPDFRGPDGLWTKVDPADFTIDRYLSSRRVRVNGWRMHQHGELWGARSDVVPNPAHRAIVKLYEAGRLAGCVTQNIDGLHKAAGLPDGSVAELHGNVREVVCLGCDVRWPTEDVLRWVDAGEEDPHCPHCGGLVKTSTVLFGELLPEDQMRRAGLFAVMCDAVIVVGSTLSVYPAAEVPLAAARRGVPMVIVNVGQTDHDREAIVKVEGKAGEVLPPMVEAVIRR
ncbi:MAG: Sir2 family NAD-dependent protein deacetylase [Acidimicrobiia bacterium]|jgi:NAD-dependent deacetylase